MFDKTHGRFTAGQARLCAKEGAVPKFCRARPIPFAIKEKVERELRRLVSEDILEPVEFSEWASPIVPVLEKNNEVRICGDFKSTFNAQCDIVQYPLPRVEELLSNFSQTN